MNHQKAYLIKEASIVNEGSTLVADVFIKNQRIEKIGSALSTPLAHKEINAENLFLLPGVIDDQVHFREPGLTHKADIYTESRAAVAGGITSFMEMPNVVPQTTTQQYLKEKYEIGKQTSLANYSFYMGATNDNLDEILKTSIQDVCGLKVFMGSSTGNMLVDNEETLETIFSNAPLLVAVHCEDEKTIRKNLEFYKTKYGEDIPMNCHPLIRSAEACYLSSSAAVSLAEKHNTRLHILHISTAKETALFSNQVPLEKKRITSEACVHHLWFSKDDYKEKDKWIKWNPAIKDAEDRTQIWQSVLDDTIDVIATDHAPHTIDEKMNLYTNCPSGGPLVQHALVAMLEKYHQGEIDIAMIAKKMAHSVATCFQVRDRGFIREGYFADLVLVDLNQPWKVKKDNILSKCGWSPFESQKFRTKVTHTFVSGHLAFEHGMFDDNILGQRLQFNR